MAASRPSHKAVTILDIAAYLGVSDATVSRALQGKLVSKQMIERVRAAAQELGYRPNIGARIMKSGRTGAFGVLVPTINHPYFARMVESFQACADRVSYNVMLGVYEEKPEICRRFIDQMVGDRRVDGLLFLPIHDPGSFDSLDEEAARRMPIVVMGGAPPHLHMVSADFQGIQRRIVQHLLDLGHRRLGFLAASIGPATPESLRAHDTRFPGLAEALASRVRSLDDVQFEHVHNSSEEGFEGALRLLRRDPRPTALMCMNDQMAIAALQAARVLRIDVPGQLSVVGTDNIDQARIFDLTTADAQVDRQAEAAVSILQRAVLGGESFQQPVRVLIPMDLIVRGSTGPAPG